MAEVDPLIFKILADSKAARKEVQDFQRLTGQGLNRVEKDVLRLEAQMKRSTGAIGGHLKGLAGTLGTLFTGRELVGMIDGFTRLQNSLRVAGLEGQALETVQTRLLNLSTKYGVNVGELAGLYGKATLAGRELGATEDQLLQITEASAQALKISGTNATQAQGALLGLTQALSSGTVRAEEFNQILEGGLQPLLQAAANSERFGGSIAKLRQAVVDGKFSSQEFYQAILAGSAELDAKASKATLTLAGAFEALTSRLTVYIGTAAQTNGATAALAGGLSLLADNIDVLIPALALVATFVGTRMVTAAIAGSAAYAGFTATLAGTASASAIATRGLAALTAAMTGPAGVALAVTAVVASFAYFSTSADNAANSVEGLKKSNENASTELDRMIGRLKAAGVQTDELAAAADRARGPIDGLADSFRQALIEARKFNAEVGATGLQQNSDDIQATQGRQATLREYIRAQRAANPGAIREGRKSPQLIRAEQQLAEEMRREALLRAQRDVRVAGMRAGVDVDSDTPVRSTSTTATKPTRTRTGNNTDPLDAVFRNEQELRQLQLEELRAKEQAATSATARADLARQALALEATMRRKDIDETQRKGQLTAEEANARRKIVDNLYGAADEITVQGRETAYQLAISREEQQRIARQQTDAMRDELDALGAEAGITDVRKSRVAIERRMLEIQQEIERALLEEAIARGDVGDAAKARAALARKQQAVRTGFEQDNQGPLGEYLDGLRKAGMNLDDQFEGIAVNGLRSLNDGLADAIANSRNLGDVFANVARSIIADLIRIAIQQTIVNALMNAAGGLFGGGGGGGLSITNLVGGAVKGAGKVSGARAGGGPVAAGQIYRVNEASSPGNPEYFRPAMSGTVIPLGQVNASASRGASREPIVIKVFADEGKTFAPRVEAISAGVSVQVTREAAPHIARSGANMAVDSIAKMQRYGSSPLGGPYR